MTGILMPKGVALWLKKNTDLSFKQIAKFCGLPLLEVININDGNNTACDPINSTFQLTSDEIKKCETDKNLDLIACNLAKPQKEKRFVSIDSKNSLINVMYWILSQQKNYRKDKLAKFFNVRVSTIEKIEKTIDLSNTQIKRIDPVSADILTEKELKEVLS